MKVPLLVLIAGIALGFAVLRSFSESAPAGSTRLSSDSAGAYDNSLRGETSEQNCIECHTKSHPTMIEAWKGSVHAEKGVGCSSCHGSNHSRIFEVKGAVSAAVCGSCHANELKEFNQSLHAEAIPMMKSDARFHHLSSSMARETCIRCHDIGRTFPDGSVGSCNSCHSGHSFSTAEARRPESCTQCHSGPDHAQDEMWLSSKHGQMFASTATQSQSATCITCHMPGGTHNTAAGLTFGTVANGAVRAGTSTNGIKFRVISDETAEQQRALMVKTCLPCHSSRFASESLAAADEVKFEADAMILEASEIVANLKKEGFLNESGNEPNGAVAAQRSYQAEIPDFAASSNIEQRLLTMIKFSHVSTFKGAYHHSPSHTYTKGFLPLQQDLNFIKAEAARLRKSKPQAQTKNEKLP